MKRILGLLAILLFAAIPAQAADWTTEAFDEKILANYDQAFTYPLVGTGDSTSPNLDFTGCLDTVQSATLSNHSGASIVLYDCPTATSPRSECTEHKNLKIPDLASTPISITRGYVLVRTLVFVSGATLTLECTDLENTVFSDISGWITRYGVGSGGGGGVGFLDQLDDPGEDEVANPGDAPVDTTFVFEDMEDFTWTFTDNSSGGTDRFVTNLNITAAGGANNARVLNIDNEGTSGSVVGDKVVFSASTANRGATSGYQVQWLEDVGVLSSAFSATASTADTIGVVFDASDANASFSIAIGSNPILTTGGQISATELNLLDGKGGAALVDVDDSPSWIGSHDFSAANLRLPASASAPSAALCDSDAERGRISVDWDAAVSSAVSICRGADGAAAWATIGGSGGTLLEEGDGLISLIGGSGGMNLVKLNDLDFDRLVNDISIRDANWASQLELDNFISNTFTGHVHTGAEITSGVIAPGILGNGFVDALTDIGDLCDATEVLQRNAADDGWECKDAVQTTITTPSNAHILVYNTDEWVNVPISGEATLAVGGALTLADGVTVASWTLNNTSLTGTLALPDGSVGAADLDLAGETYDFSGSTIRAYQEIVTKTESGSPHTIGANEVKNTLICNTGASAATVYNLPSAAAGMVITVCVSAAFDVDVNANTGDQILVLTNATGDAVSSDATVGSVITLVALDGTNWFPVGYRGTWTDVN